MEDEIGYIPLPSTEEKILSILDEWAEIAPNFMSEDFRKILAKDIAKNLE